MMIGLVQGFSTWAALPFGVDSFLLWPCAWQDFE